MWGKDRQQIWVSFLSVEAEQQSCMCHQYKKSFAMTCRLDYVLLALALPSVSAFSNMVEIVDPDLAEVWLVAPGWVCSQWTPPVTSTTTTTTTTTTPIPTTTNSWRRSHPNWEIPDGWTQELNVVGRCPMYSTRRCEHFGPIHCRPVSITPSGLACWQWISTNTTTSSDEETAAAEATTTRTTTPPLTEHATAAESPSTTTEEP
jgi:hypothetical protein